jgi:hypothetical protein
MALPDPQSFDTPLYWEPAMLKELAGSAVLDEAIAEQTRVRAVFKVRIGALRSFWQPVLNALGVSAY